MPPVVKRCKPVVARDAPLHPRDAPLHPRVQRALAMIENTMPGVPPCVRSMACLCACHAAGLAADEPCDTSEARAKRLARDTNTAPGIEWCDDGGAYLSNRRQSVYFSKEELLTLKTRLTDRFTRRAKR